MNSFQKWKHKKLQIWYYIIETLKDTVTSGELIGATLKDVITEHSGKYNIWVVKA